MTSYPAQLGERALELVHFDGKRFRLISEMAFAPGQPMRIEVALSRTLALDLKSLGSVRRADGRFDVRARAATLTREARTELLAAFAAS